MPLNAIELNIMWFLLILFIGGDEEPMDTSEPAPKAPAPA